MNSTGNGCKRYGVLCQHAETWGECMITACTNPKVRQMSDNPIIGTIKQLQSELNAANAKLERIRALCVDQTKILPSITIDIL